MRESILTIPITDIFEPEEGCPICRMRDMLEDRAVEYIMGSAMMEPDVRIETNKQGFCKIHFDKMLAQKNRLSLALMLQSHLMELDKSIFSKRSIFEGLNAKQKKVTAVNNDCFICSKIEWGMSRLMQTVFDMYAQSKEFRDMFERQEFICVNHYDMLVSVSETELDKKYRKQFVTECERLVKKGLTGLIEDVSHYCNMYDYRNTGKDADWGNSRDSIERAIRFLTTR
ncbi:MAG: DUF6062 family protein [Ruminococcus sp.]|nr:DUF6062 family protein [Ruminococcus sp.]